jgi:hypothetical protein
MQSGGGGSAIRACAVSLRTSSLVRMHLQTDSVFSPSSRAYIVQPLLPARKQRPCSARCNRENYYLIAHWLSTNAFAPGYRGLGQKAVMSSWWAQAEAERLQYCMLTLACRDAFRFPPALDCSACPEDACRANPSLSCNFIPRDGSDTNASRWQSACLLQGWRDGTPANFRLGSSTLRLISSNDDASRAHGSLLR